MTDASSRAPVSLLWSIPDDARAIAAVHATLFPTPWEPDAVQALIEHPAAVSLVAALPGRKIVGFVIAQIAADEAEILSIGVAAETQRQGIGRKLLDGTIRAATRAEARRLNRELHRAKLIEATSVPSDVVTMNSTVSYEDTISAERRTVTLVYPWRSRERSTLNVLSPIGTALLGLRAGNTIEWRLDDGSVKSIRVLSVAYQPEAAGDWHL